MDGMIILWTEEVAQTGFGISPIIILPILCGIAFLVFLIAAFITGSYDLGKVSDLILILFFIVSILALAFCSDSKIIGYKTHYHVIFNEKVDMNELSEKYNIIGQKGIEYTLVEKEN